VRRVTVVCGCGNNGGDGMMAARLLASAGLEVTTLLLGARDSLAGDAAVAWRELTSPAHGLIHIIETPEDLAGHKAALEADLILDAVVGTGFQAAAERPRRRRTRMAEGPARRQFLPSIFPPAGRPTRPQRPLPSRLAADAVITFTAPKPAHVFGQLTRRWSQPIVVAPIGSPEEAMVSALGLHWTGSALALTQTRRTSAANKATMGMC